MTAFKRLLALFLCLLPALASAHVLIPIEGGKTIAGLTVQFSNQTSIKASASKWETMARVVDEVWRESSGGKVWVERIDTFVPVKMAGEASGGPCRNVGWTTSAAMAAGIGLYDYDLITSTSTGSCSSRGAAAIASPHSWLSDAAAGFAIHEFGHNWGLQHSSCTGSVYCDRADPMGTTAVRLFAAPTRVMAGWMQPSSVLEITGPGTFEIAPLETLNPALQVLWAKLSDGRALWLSMRGAIGRDASLDADWRDRVQVHITAPAAGTMIFPAITVGPRVVEGGAYTLKAEGVTVAVEDIEPSVRARMRVEWDGKEPMEQPEPEFPDALAEPCPCPEQPAPEPGPEQQPEQPPPVTEAEKTP
ncbi:MAG TPA: hypothetical protein PK177_13550, partial [Burkholderiaceae bacterium]|nr:hypothetical protein [Burkholderiaceae bacterium]